MQENEIYRAVEPLIFPPGEVALMARWLKRPTQARKSTNALLLFISVLRPVNRYGYLKAIHTLKFTNNQK